ncbi:hypothetical protein AGMMS4957_09630 [Bacteroidia bacterium]|nr:hypothetical protein AGMMS4957_09630 [Bacteroidia bacterium]
MKQCGQSNCVKFRCLYPDNYYPNVKTRRSYLPDGTLFNDPEATMDSMDTLKLHIQNLDYTFVLANE